MATEPETNGETEANAKDSASEYEALDFRALDAQYTPISPFNEWLTLAVDNAIWDRQTGYLKERRAALSPKAFEDALDVAMRAAALETGAIEGLYETDRGFTINVATKADGWQSLMRTKGSQIQEFFEAHLRALALATDEAAAKRPVTEVWIRQLHEVLTEPQDEYEALTPQGWVWKPLPKGVYKEQPNHVKQVDGSIHAYAPVASTPLEMSVLVEQLNSGDFATAHPVLQSSYAHYAFVAIHPFVDGNGRVARVLASIFLQRTDQVPLLIWKFQEKQYFQALADTDGGGKHAFVDFIFDRALDAVMLVANELGPSASDQMAGFSDLYISHAGLTFEDLDKLAARLSQHVNTVIDAATGQLERPNWLEISKGAGGNFPVQHSAYRQPVSGPNVRHVRLRTPAPAAASVDFHWQITISAEREARYAFRLECTSSAAVPLEIRLEDVESEISQALTTQIEAWAERLFADALSTLNVKAHNAREGQGL